MATTPTNNTFEFTVGSDTETQETCDVSDSSSNDLSADLLQEFNSENESETESETSTNNTNNSSPHHAFKKVKCNNENTLSPTLTEINQ